MGVRVGLLRVGVRMALARPPALLRLLHLHHHAGQSQRQGLPGLPHLLRPRIGVVA